MLQYQFWILTMLNVGRTDWPPSLEQEGINFFAPTIPEYSTSIMKRLLSSAPLSQFSTMHSIRELLLERR